MLVNAISKENISAVATSNVRSRSLTESQCVLHNPQCCYLHTILLSTDSRNSFLQLRQYVTSLFVKVKVALVSFLDKPDPLAFIFHCLYLTSLLLNIFVPHKFVAKHHSCVRELDPQLGLC